ncbi:MAG: hypothetical protein IJ697_03720 [Synergistaceae bacterium]|nr:hypothetical protein [Synergistaceae bacterium]MBR1657556.1 hypothetical protein [Synergistaceae bacterium]
MEEVKAMPLYITRPEIDYCAIDLLKELGRMSVLQGKDKITQAEIDEEISAYRAGR